MTRTTAGRSRLFYGYIVLAAGVAIQLVGWGIFGTYGVFFKSLQTEFDASRATISSVASVALLMHGIASIFAGSLADRIGPRLVVSVCGTLFGLGLLLTSRVNHLWQLYLTYGIVFGAGVSAFDVVVLSTIARWFVRSRGVITGVAKVGAGIGHMVMPLAAGALIAGYQWRTAYVGLGVLSLVAIVVAAQFLRRDPAAMSLEPDGNGRAGTGKSPPAEGGISLRAAVRRRQFWLLLAAYSTIVFTTYTIQVHIAPHAVDLGNSVTQAAGVLAVMGAASTIGRLTMGKVGDVVGTSKAMMLCAGAIAVTLLALAFARERWMLYAITPIYAFAHGGSYSLISPMVARLFGTGSHGAIYGVVIFGGTVGGTIGPLMAGYVFDRVSSYQPVFLVLSAMAAVGLALLVLLRTAAAKETGA